MQKRIRVHAPLLSRLSHHGRLHLLVLKHWWLLDLLLSLLGRHLSRPLILVLILSLRRVTLRRPPPTSRWARGCCSRPRPGPRSIPAPACNDCLRNPLSPHNIPCGPPPLLPKLTPSIFLNLPVPSLLLLGADLPLHVFVLHRIYGRNPELKLREDGKPVGFGHLPVLRLEAVERIACEPKDRLGNPRHRQSCLGFGIRGRTCRGSYFSTLVSSLSLPS